MHSCNASAGVGFLRAASSVNHGACPSLPSPPYKTRPAFRAVPASYDETRTMAETPEYRDTLFLPKTDFPMRAGLPKREPEWLAHWDRIGLYEAQRRAAAGREPFELHDGPPYANGNLHIGHALNKILKDVVVRSHQINGRKVNFQMGWDTFGLPIELAVGKGKSHEQYGSFADGWIKEQKYQFEQFGAVGTTAHHYETKSPAYVQNIRNTFDELKKKGFIKKKFKPVFWDEVAETVLSSSEIEYKDVHHKTATVLFLDPVKEVYVPVWTTQPWTLQVCEYVTFNKELEYAVYMNDEKRRVVFEVESVPEGWSYAEDYDPETTSELSVPWNEDLYVDFLHSDHVTNEKGTGFVQIAPSHEDKEYVKNPRWNDAFLVDGGLTENKTNIMIAACENSGRLLDQNLIVHSFPVSTRTGAPVYLRWVKQWFFELTPKFKKRCLKALEKVEFYPESARQKLKDMVDSRDDWCISRQRSWGVQIPDSDDILDVWFDSGCSFLLLNGQQSDLVLEGKDQHRGWFQSSLLISMALTGKPPYKRVLSHGFTVDKSGQKMSKSVGNVVSPFAVINDHSLDVLRLWICSSNIYSDISISDEILKGVETQYKKIRNTCKFILGNLPPNYTPTTHLKEDMSVVEQYVLDELTKLDEEISNHYNNMEFSEVVRKTHTFCNETLSQLYFDIRKDTLYCDSTEEPKRIQCLQTLHTCLKHIQKWTSPILIEMNQELEFHK